MMPAKTVAIGSFAAALLMMAPAPSVRAQSSGTSAPAVAAGTTAPGPSEKSAPPADYVIGPNDILSIVFWREKDMSTDVVVRPDGRVSLPLLNDIVAVGLTPEELRARITELSARYIQDPSVSVVVKQINSRVVYITGLVGKPGPYPLMQPTSVMQLIAMAGGLSEWADEEGIVVMRTENGKPVRYKFNYKWVLAGLNMRQNIELKPGDTVLVP